jgi:hypothetical protein
MLCVFFSEAALQISARGITFHSKGAMTEARGNKTELGIKGWIKGKT